jgi:hypothetical protein
MKFAAGRTVAIGLGLMLAFTAVYTAAFHEPRPHGMPVGVVGDPPHPALLALTAAGFDVHSYGTETAARRALLDADVHGVLVRGAPADRVLVTGAYGKAPTQVITAALEGVARRDGRPVTVRDLRPLPRHDALGLAAFFTVFGTALPSLLFGALLAIFHRSQPGRVRRTILASYALLGGIVVALSVEDLVGALSGDFWAVAGVAALLALAVASLSFGLERLLGPPGVAAAAIVVMLLGQSSTGGAVGHSLQPGFYGAISQLLPNGAALTAMRNVVYFGGAHIVAPLLVLVAWAVAGLGVEVVAGRRAAAPRVAAVAGGGPGGSENAVESEDADHADDAVPARATSERGGPSSETPR